MMRFVFLMKTVLVLGVFQRKKFVSASFTEINVLFFLLINRYVSSVKMQFFRCLLMENVCFLYF